MIGEGKCQTALSLMVGRLNCDREADHPGMHRDNLEGVYWTETAPPLEVIELPRCEEPGFPPDYDSRDL